MIEMKLMDWIGWMDGLGRDGLNPRCCLIFHSYPRITSEMEISLENSYNLIGPMTYFLR